MTFNELNLSAPLLRAIAEAGYETPSPIQAKAIPPVLEGRDLMGCAQTGTGKTAAFALPMLDRLNAAKPRKPGAIRALILTPTRELALQIGESFAAYGKYQKLRTTVIFGGVGQAPQVEAIKKGVEILIACPGRLNDLVGQGLVDLSNIEIFVLDEADRMLDMGFFDDIMQIVKQMPTKRQTILFSATLPPKIRQLAKQILKDPAEINIAISKPNEAIIQSAYICYETQKMAIIQELFSKPNRKKTIIFSSSKQKVKDLAYSLKRMKLNVAAMHSDLEQEQREAVMLDFKNGKTDILVATDIVARGIDIDDIGLVINYDVPHDPEDYIHRIGRTARANADGVAITFVCEPEQGKFHKIEEFIEKDIYKIPLPPTVGPGPVYNPQAFERRPRGKFKNNRPGRKRPYTRKKNFNKPEN